MADTQMQLCNDENGMVEGGWLDLHNRLTTAAGHEPTETPFACTGGACYVMGDHIRCTSEFHKRPLPAPMVVSNQRDGLALVRTAADVRAHFAGDPGVPQDFWDDLATIDRVGRHLVFAKPITLPLTNAHLGIRAGA